ncbi:MAG TPA: GNAT family N-acetyltransferase [Anaerolineae bacterium]|nr:GNAT family N-acetyltransferase [Anaerolineae bacterium]
MSAVAELVHAIWIKAQIKAPPVAQRALLPRLHAMKELARAALKPYVPVYQLQGPGQAGPLFVTYIGLEFARPVLQQLLFAEQPSVQPVGRIPYWRPDALAEFTRSDLVIVAAARRWIQRLPWDGAIVAPEYVRHVLDLQGDWQDVLRRMRQSARYEFRLAQTHGYTCEISHNARDFQMFYDEMYLPTMANRHGALSAPTPRGEAYQYFRHGLLFFARRDGRRVCGGICYPERGALHFVVVGVLGGDPQLLRERAVDALNCLRIEWAHQHGYRAINFLGTGPYLNLGQFQYKRKWGGRVFIPANLHRSIWIRINRDTPAVARFLKDNPFVVVDQAGNLDGLILVDDGRNVTAQDRAEWIKRYATPGLRSLVVRSVRDLVGGSAGASGRELSIPLAGSADLEHRS